MQAENYFCHEGSFSTVSKQETLLKFFVQRRSSLAYDAKVSEYEAFAYISLLLVARLSVGRNVLLQKAIDVLQEDAGWTSVSGYIKKVMRNPSIENVWINLSMMELPNSLEELYDVYCHALDMVPERSRVGTFNLPHELISGIIPGRMWLVSHNRAWEPIRIAVILAMVWLLSYPAMRMLEQARRYVHVKA